jgi:hypothetical protein
MKADAGNDGSLEKPPHDLACEVIQATAIAPHINDQPGPVTKLRQQFVEPGHQFHGAVITPMADSKDRQAGNLTAENRAFAGHSGSLNHDG